MTRVAPLCVELIATLVSNHIYKWLAVVAVSDKDYKTVNAVSCIFWV